MVNVDKMHPQAANYLMYTILGCIAFCGARLASLQSVCMSISMLGPQFLIDPSHLQGTFGGDAIFHFACAKGFRDTSAQDIVQHH